MIVLGKKRIKGRITSLPHFISLAFQQRGFRANSPTHPFSMGTKSEDEAGCSSVDEESYKTLKQ